LPLGVGGLNPLLTIIDYDDANALGSLQAAQGYDNCQETPLGQYVERTFVPRVAMAVYSSAVGLFSSYGQKRSWLDTTSNTVPHFGLKYFIAAAPGTYASVYSIEVDVIISFMGVK